MNPMFFKTAMFAAAVLLAIVWLKIVATANWNLYGLAGVAISLISAIPLCIGNHQDQRFVTGLTAGAIAIVAFGIGDYRRNEPSSDRTQSVVIDNTSFITALAEQKMMYRSPAFGGKPGAVQGFSDGIPMAIDSHVIPEKILKEATAEWNALPESTKQKIKVQRVQATQQFSTDNLEYASTLVSWLIKIGMMSVVGIVAFTVASAPAILAMKR